MTHWKLIALDLDGTLLNEEGSISDENRKGILQARKAGIEVTIATGRPARLIYPYINQLQLTAPFVAANGSEVWTADGRLLERHTLKPADVSFLYDIALEFGTRYYSSVAGHVFPPGTFPEKIEDHQWLKFGFQSEYPGLIERIGKRLADYGRLEITSSGPTNVEVNPEGISKATGLQTVCRYLGIDRRAVVAIGDGLNDVAMMRWAGLGIAMGNAHEEVKAVAGQVTVHHQEHGVARAIEHILEGFAV